MTLRPASGALLAAGALALALALSGCTPPTPSASPSSTPSASPSSAPSPAPTETAVAASCDTVLTDAEYASLAEDGLVLRDDEGFPLGPAMSDLIADGALHCQWSKPQSDIAAWYAQLAEDDAAWSSRSAELQAAGWTVSDAPIPGTLLAPADYDANYQPSIVHVDGVTYFVSYADLLTSVAALQ